MRDNAVEKLFSLFASSERAEAMAGDLAEEREQRGWIWFWLHVMRITLALWRDAAMDAPLHVLALTMTGCALLAAPAFAGAAAVGLFPTLMGSLVTWIPLSLFWWGGALWTGASLIAIAPRRGMVACATLAATGQALLIVLGVMASPADLSKSEGALFRVFYATALVAPMLLLAGGSVAHRRLIARGMATLCALLVALPDGGGL